MNDGRARGEQRPTVRHGWHRPANYGQQLALVRLYVSVFLPNCTRVEQWADLYAQFARCFFFLIFKFSLLLKSSAKVK